MVILKRQSSGNNRDLRPGQWRVPEPNKRGEQAVVRCPGCAVIVSIGPAHQVAKDGTVTPSFFHNVAGCEYHEWATLEDWTPEVTA